MRRKLKRALYQDDVEKLVQMFRHQETAIVQIIKVQELQHPALIAQLGQLKVLAFLKLVSANFDQGVMDRTASPHPVP